MKRSKNFLILVVVLSLVAIALAVAHRATRQPTRQPKRLLPRGGSFVVFTGCFHARYATGGHPLRSRAETSEGFQRRDEPLQRSRWSVKAISSSLSLSLL